MKKIILCYRRKSQVRDRADLISPQKQTAAVEASVTILEGDFITEWYEDIAGHRSGRTEQGRPGWLQLKEQLQRADVAGIACYSLSRIYRNVREFLLFVEELNRLELRLLVVKERIDTHTPTGLAIMTILMAMYQLESDLASSRMTDTIAFKRHTLKQHWGPIPFGCIRDPESGNLAPDPARVYLPDADGNILERSYYGALKRAYELYITGDYTYASLAAALNAENWQYRTRDGQARPFNRDDTRRLLNLHKVYRGSITVGRNKDEDTVEITDAHSPILPPEICHQVAALLATRAKRHRSPGHHQHLLSGILICAECRQTMAGTTRKGRRYYLHRHNKGACSQSWQFAEELEQDAIRRIAALCPTAQLPELRERLAAADSDGDHIRRTYAQLAKYENALDRLAELYLDNAITRDRYQLQYTRLTRQIATLHTTLAQLQESDTHAALARLHRLSHEIATLPAAQQREEIMSTFTAIHARDGHIVELVPAAWLATIWVHVLATISQEILT